MKRIIIQSMACLLMLSGCAWFAPKPAPTQLEVREFQTRTFDIKDPKLVIKALLAVLQDEGYIVKSADMALGFISASKERDLGGAPLFFPATTKGEPARWKKLSLIETTANVSEFGAQCRVRANFQEKILDNMGAVIEVRQINDEKFYQDFFMKVDKGLFLQKEKL